MQSPVKVISARDFSRQDVIVPARFRLHFPAHWRASPVQNRYATALERETISWLARYGIGETAAEREKLRKFNCGMYGGYSLPGAPFASALLVTQFISLWLFWDDVEVEENIAWSIEDVVSALRDARGEASPANRYIAAWADLGRRLRPLTSEAWLQRLSDAMRAWLDNAKVETAMARAFRERRAVPEVEALLECRTISIGMFPTFYLIELSEGIELDAAFHEHPDVCGIKRMASRLVGMGNDLGGIAKDLINRWLNLVVVIAERSALPLEEAFAELVARHNAEVIAFDRAAARLPRFGPATDPFVAGWVQAVRHNVYGFALWESLAERYQEYKAVVGNTALLAAASEG